VSSGRVLASGPSTFEPRVQSPEPRAQSPERRTFDLSCDLLAYNQPHLHLLLQHHGRHLRRHDDHLVGREPAANPRQHSGMAPMVRCLPIFHRITNATPSATHARLLVYSSRKGPSRGSTRRVCGFTRTSATPSAHSPSPPEPSPGPAPASGACATGHAPPSRSVTTPAWAAGSAGHLDTLLTRVM
jgi:hypothetical protein